MLHQVAKKICEFINATLYSKQKGDLCHTIKQKEKYLCYIVMQKLIHLFETLCWEKDSFMLHWKENKVIYATLYSEKKY